MRRKSTIGLALGLLLGLGGCSVPNWANPVEWYRDATGISNDDTTGEERNTQNLDQGGKAPYPNLASVPPPPTNALSAEERDKLRNSLAADQANAKYLENSDQLVPTPPSAAPSPTSPQRPTAQPTPPPTPSPPQPAAAAPPAPQPPSPPAPPPKPTAAAPPPSPPQRAAAPPTPSPPAPAPSAPLPPQSASAPPPPSTAAPSGTLIPQVSGVQRAPVRGSEAPPQESPLTPPTVRSVPQGEAPRPAPPPPPSVRPQAPSAPAPAPAPPPQTASLPPPSSAPTAAPSAPSGGGSAVTVTIGSVVLQAGNKLSPGDHDQLASIARLRQQNGGIIHVTGYSVPGAGRDPVSQQMAGFGAALEHAKAVAQALTQAGVPTQYVVVGAVPAPPGQPSSTVELSLEY